jgi:hypothetical protein
MDTCLLPSPIEAEVDLCDFFLEFIESIPTSDGGAYCESNFGFVNALFALPCPSKFI